MKTNQQSLTIRVRENFRKQLRKKELERNFAEHRKNWQAEVDRKQKEQFYRIYPDICEDNYRQHLPFLLHYANNPSYNFSLLPHAGYVYEALLENPTNEQPLLILEGLSQYEEIELPQTQEFVEVLLQALPQKSKTVLNIIANLLEYPRYSQELRDLLLQEGFIRRGQEMVSFFVEQDIHNEISQTSVALFFCCCCEFIKSHPRVPFPVFLEITSTMSNLLAGQEERFMLFQTLGSISSSFQPDLEVANHLLKLFQQVAFQEYHNHQYEIIQFAIYCLLSHIYLPSPFQQLLMSSLESHSSVIVCKVLTAFQFHIKNFEQFDRRQVYLQLKQLGFLNQLNSLFTIQKVDAYQDCLQCLQLLARCIALDENDPEQSNRLVFIITSTIDLPHSDVLLQALNILLIAIQAVRQEELIDSSLITFLQRENIEARLQSITNVSQETATLIELILQLLK